MANGNGNGAWKMATGCLLSAVVSGVAAGFFFQIGTSTRMASIETQQQNNTSQIDRLTGNLNKFVEEQNRFFREQAGILADLRARLNALDSSGK